MLIYNTSTLGTTTNLITFNSDATEPYFRLTNWLFAHRSLAEYDIKLPEGSGVADYQTFIGKCNMLLEGTMYPSDEAGYSTGEKLLRKVASLDVEQADANSDQGYVPFKVSDDDGVNKQVWVKVLYVDTPKRPRNGLKLPFRLFCKVKYPAWFAQTASTATLGSSTATTSGSSNLSFALPLAIGLTTYSSNGTITNSGDLPTYPSITITGPITTPRVTNSTTGKYIELTVNLSTSSDSVIITYDQDTLSVTQAGSSVLNQLTSGSTLFKLNPGTNTLTLTGATVGSGAFASVSCNSAWPLS